MAPVIRRLKDSRQHHVRVCLTGQHMDLVDPIMELFGIESDYTFNAMNEASGPQQLTAKVMKDVTSALKDFKPHLILVHGDTTSALAAALAAFYMKVPIGHVEAGLRTESITSPWPEECNRRLISVMCDIHFAPTKNAFNSLLNEGVSSKKIHITGNTVIDALYQAIDILESDVQNTVAFCARYPIFKSDKRIILVTAHRRENIGSGIDDICNALLELNQKLPEHQILLPAHPNPAVREHFLAKIDGFNGISILPPFDYIDFVLAMNRAEIILTDSGGIQEEAPSLNIPVLVLRDVTERPEAISAGTAQLVGTNTRKIVKTVLELVEDTKKYKKISSKKNPFGDGNASLIIERALTKWTMIN